MKFLPNNNNNKTLVTLFCLQLFNGLLSKCVLFSILFAETSSSIEFARYIEYVLRCVVWFTFSDNI